MRKLYRNLDRYLFNFNSDDGAGSGGTPTTPVVETPPSTGEATPPVADWKDSISPDLKDSEVLQGAESVDDLIKALQSKNAPPASEPTLVIPEGVSGKVAEYATARGFKQEDVDGLLTLKTELDADADTALLETNKAGMVELAKTWGSPEDVKANLALANRVVEFADPEGKLKLKEFLNSRESGYANNNPMIVSMFLGMGKAFKEAGFLKSENPPAKADGKGNFAHEMYPANVPK